MDVGVTRIRRPPHSLRSPSSRRRGEKALWRGPRSILCVIAPHVRIETHRRVCVGTSRRPPPFAATPEASFRDCAACDSAACPNHNCRRVCLVPRLCRVKKLPSWKGSEAGSRGEGHEDVLVVPGDISSSLDRSVETLTELKKRYDEVWSGAAAPRSAWLCS